MAARFRLQARIARDDKRTWVVKRRERTRHLIELGGLVVKAGLVELTDDNRAVLFGITIDTGRRLGAELAFNHGIDFGRGRGLGR